MSCSYILVLFERWKELSRFAYWSLSVLIFYGEQTTTKAVEFPSSSSFSFKGPALKTYRV